MVVLDGPAEPVDRDMGVDLRGGNVCMAQQGLNHPQVSPAFEQVGGKRVSQYMRTDPGRVDPGSDGSVIQQLGEPPRGQVAAATTRWKQPYAVGRAGFAACITHSQP